MELSLGAGCAQTQRRLRDHRRGSTSKEKVGERAPSQGKKDQLFLQVLVLTKGAAKEGRQAGAGLRACRDWPFCPRTGKRAGKGSWGSGAGGATFPSLAPASWCPESWRESTPSCLHRHGRGLALGPVPSWPGHRPRPKPAATSYKALKPQFLVSSMRGHLFTPSALAHRKHPVKIRSSPALTVLTHGHCRSWAPSPPAGPVGSDPRGQQSASQGWVSVTLLVGCSWHLHWLRLSLA